MPGGAEGDLLGGVGRVGLDGVVRGDEGGDVDQVAGLGGLSGTRGAHALILARQASTRPRNLRSVSRKTSGCSECTQWPAFLIRTSRVAGKSASMRGRSSAST